MAKRRRTLSLPPPCVAVRSQLHRADCGVAALAMALGLPYEQVFQAAPLAGRDGLTTRQLQSVATRLGARLLPKADADLHADTGILGVDYKKGAGHWLYLFAGTLVEPTHATLWDVEDYFAHTCVVEHEFLVVSPARVRQRGKK
jgi:hypothetical protein